MQSQPIELLAPAGNATIGIAAINHGADAVYIGAPKFSARAAAGTPLSEIGRLTDYAHRFHARVYVALNTLLHDDELAEATAIIHDLHDMGADALIIQDLGLLECDLPPIPLHASTQTDNRNPEKVKFLEDIGFSRVVLARELNLEEIAAIRAASSVALEFFVHGALCVSYSGCCIFSETVAGRSANRGRCAQFCRHSYTLKDGNGRILKDQGHLLSLKDLNLSARLPELLAAGITSLKIEGRLKDIEYVKNVTAFYRRTLDKIIDAGTKYCRASSGRCTFDFISDPERTFHRGSTEYFLMGKRERIAALATPKSTGKKVGRVVKTGDGSFEIDGVEEIASGDGLCYFDSNNRLVGMRVNRANGRRIFPKDRVVPAPETPIYRNFDHAFQQLLKKSDNCRNIGLSLAISGTCGNLKVTATDEDGCRTDLELNLEAEPARNPELMRKNLIRQLKKSGKTIFSILKVDLAIEKMPYLQLAVINTIRRQTLARHLQTRLARYTPLQKPHPPNTTPWPAALPAPQGHLQNHRARAFFARHGVPAIEIAASSAENNVLMTTRYCLKAELGLCPTRGHQPKGPAEPLTLVDRTGTYELNFDCRCCEMRVLLRHRYKNPLDRE